MPPRVTRYAERNRNFRSRHTTTLDAQLRFLNPRPHPSIVLYQLYTQIAEARGLDPIVPFFVSNNVLQTMDNANVNTRGMRSSLFFLDFDRSADHWEPARVPGNRRPYKRFTGGTITGRAVVAIFIDERARFKRRAIEKIMEHEMDHARDSKNSLNSEVMRDVRGDQLVTDHLIDRNPIEESNWQHWFATAQPSAYRQRLDAILAAARTVEPDTRLINPASSDFLAGHRPLDAFLFVRVWKPASERHGRALHRDAAHIQTMNDVVQALSEPDDPDLYREHHGRLPEGSV